MGLRQYSREEGIQQGEVLVLQRQLQRRFGPLPEWVTEKLAQANQTSRETWADRVLDAGTLEEVFAECPAGLGPCQRLCGNAVADVATRAAGRLRDCYR